MYDNQPKKDWVNAAMTAALGAGIVTTVAVGQGQNPFLALGITGFATVAAVLFDHYFCS